MLGQTGINISDIIADMLTRKIMICFSISLCVAGAFTPASAHTPLQIPISPPFIKGENHQWEEILREAGQKTDVQFASKISSLTLTKKKTDISVNLIDRTFTTEAVMVFDGEIKPYIKTKFEEDISDEYLIVQRKLLKVHLYRVEVIDGRDVYSVHIDFVVRITERESGFEYITLRGQETLFLIKNGKIEDIIPFDEYVTEKDEKEVKKFATEDTEGK